MVALLLAGLPLQAKDQAPPVAPQDRLLVLPVEFAYYKYQSTGPIEVIPDRTELARRNLEDSLQRALKRDDKIGSGKLGVTVNVGTSGMVKNVSISAPPEFGVVESCIKQAVKRWTFPANNEDYQIEFPLIMAGNQ